MEWLPECRKTVNTFVNRPTSILDVHTLNIIVNPTDIENIIECVLHAIVKGNVPKCVLNNFDGFIAFTVCPEPSRALVH